MEVIMYHRGAVRGYWVNTGEPVFDTHWTIYVLTVLWVTIDFSYCSSSSLSLPSRHTGLQAQPSRVPTPVCLLCSLSVSCHVPAAVLHSPHPDPSPYWSLVLLHCPPSLDCILPSRSGHHCALHATWSMALNRGTSGRDSFWGHTEEGGRWQVAGKRPV